MLLGRGTRVRTGVRHLRDLLVAAGAGVLAVSVPASVAAAAPPDESTPPAAPPDQHPCAEGAPEGWTVIEHASSYDTYYVLCNFSAPVGDGKAADAATIPSQVTLFPDDTIDPSTPIESSIAGTAVTIEYFCTAEQAQERWQGITGSTRATEVYRDATKVVAEEGRMADTAAGRAERDLITTYFFPDKVFALQQKAWILYNPQVLATIAVITSSREVTVETMAEDAARVVAANFGPEPVAGCEIPRVEAGGNGDGDGGGLGPVVVIGVGGGAIVAIGGITVWRRDPKKSPGKIPAAPARTEGVPPHCRAVADLYDEEVAKLTTLEEAASDTVEILERAEKIHRNNVVKAKMVVNLEIITAFGGMATDLATALRPAVLRRTGPRALGEMDNWHPPGSIGAKLAEQIEAARVAARNAWSKFQTLSATVEQLLGPLEERVRNLPSVQLAQRLWEANMNRLGQMIDDLPKANALRTKLTQLDAAVESTGNAMKAFERGPLHEAKRAVSEAESALHASRNALPPNYHIAVKDLADAQDMMAKAAEDTLSQSKAADFLDRARANMAKVTRDAKGTLADVEAAEKALAAAKTKLSAAEQQLEALTKPYTRAVDKRQTTFNELVTQYNDVTPAAIDQQGRVAGQAQRELDQAMAAGRAELGKDLEQARAARNQAEVEAASAQGLYDDLRAQAELGVMKNAKQDQPGGILSSIGRAIWWATGVVRVPITMVGEIVMGVGQSPQEIMEILLQGRHNIQLYRSRLAAIRRAIYNQRRTISRVKRRLDACVKSTPALADPVHVANVA